MSKQGVWFCLGGVHIDFAVSCTRREVRLRSVMHTPRSSTTRVRPTEDFDSAVSYIHRGVRLRGVRSIAEVDSAVSCIHREDRLRGGQVHRGDRLRGVMHTPRRSTPLCRDHRTVSYTNSIILAISKRIRIYCSLYCLSGARVGLIDEKWVSVTKIIYFLENIITIVKSFKNSLKAISQTNLVKWRRQESWYMFY